MDVVSPALGTFLEKHLTLKYYSRCVCLVIYSITRLYPIQRLSTVLFPDPRHRAALKLVGIATCPAGPAGVGIGGNVQPMRTGDTQTPYSKAALGM